MATPSASHSQPRAQAQAQRSTVTPTAIAPAMTSTTTTSAADTATSTITTRLRTVSNPAPGHAPGTAHSHAPAITLDCLTEFAPLHTELKPTGGFFSRLFKRTPDEVSVVEEMEVITRDADNMTADSTSEDRKSSHGSSSSDSDTALPSTVAPPRTLSGVLKRLGTILDRRSQTPQAYKDSDFRQFWMPDRHCHQCYECSERFNTFRRRHHCRICGQVFCSHCCNQELPGNIMGYTGYLRVCTYCCKVVLSYAQYQDASGNLLDLSNELYVNADADASDVASHESVATPGGYSAQRRRQRSTLTSAVFEDDFYCQGLFCRKALSLNPFDVTPSAEYATAESFQKERKILLQDSAQLRDLCFEIRHPADGVQLQNHRYRLRTYPGCLVGSELVDWLLSRDKATSRVQAIAIGQALVDAKWLECVTSTDQLFRDMYALYRPGQTAFEDSPGDELLSPSGASVDDAEPLWFKEIQRHDDYDDGFDRADFDKDSTEVPAAVSNSVFYVSRKSDSRGHASLQGSMCYDTSSSNLSSIDKGVEARQYIMPLRHTRLPSGSYAVIQNIALDSPLGSRDSTDIGFVRVESGIAGMSAVEQDSASGTCSRDDVGWHSDRELTDRDGDRQAFQRISWLMERHRDSLLAQLLGRARLPAARWTAVILRLVRQVTAVVRPDVRRRADNMDIRHYVAIKKIAGGCEGQTGVVSGVVCTKNVAHKRMRCHMLAPKILLLQAPIVYQRVESKFSSLEPQILQEAEYLKNCVARIAALQPDLLLVGNTVSRLAQTYLFKCNITLVLNVKPSVMERVSRLTRAEIAKSIDGLVTKTAMGSCQVFRVQQHQLPDGEVKTLMYFDGCAPHLGCTITLRGGPLSELRKVKKVLRFMTYAVYHSRLERSFLMDEFATPKWVPAETAFNLSPERSSLGTDDVCFSDEVTVAVDKVSPDADAMTGMLMRQSVDMDTTTRDIPTAVVAVTDVEGPSPFDRDDEMLGVEAIEVETGVTMSVATETDRAPIPPPSPPAAAPPPDIPDGAPIVEAPAVAQDCAGARPVVDFSDPLRCAARAAASSAGPQVALREVPAAAARRFRAALDAVLLSVSPLVPHEVPFLETEAGFRCPLRPYLPAHVYWSALMEPPAAAGAAAAAAAEGAGRDRAPSGRQPVRLGTAHAFVTRTLRAPLTDVNIQTLLCDFRAQGSRLPAPWSWQPNETAGIPALETVQAEAANDEQVDCLDPYQHQRLSVCFSSFSRESVNAPNPCVYPWIVSMDFYGRNGMSLGGFLQRYCFSQSYSCPSVCCDTAMTEHTRRFVHAAGCLQVVLKRLDSPVPAENLTDILIWSWCRHCKQVTPVVPLSTDAWSMSFTKYLELRFHGDAYRRRSDAQSCSHSIHRDHYQYFGQGNIVASFKYSPICLKETILPPKVITLEETVPNLTAFIDDTKVVALKGTGAFGSIMDHLCRLKRDTQTDTLTSAAEDDIAQLQGEVEQFKQSVQQTLPSCDPGVSEELRLFELQDRLVVLKYHVTETLLYWNHRINELDQLLKKSEKTKMHTSSARRDTVVPVENSIAGPTTRLHTAKDSIHAASENVASITQVSGVKPSPVDTTSRRDADPSSQAAPQTVLPPAVPTLHRPPNCPPPPPAAADRSPGINHADSLLPEETDCSPAHAPEGRRGHHRSRSLNENKKPPKTGPPSSDAAMTDVDRGERRTTMKKIFTRVLPAAASTVFVPLPFDPSEHLILTSPSRSVPLIIYDQEPSSIIAFSLSSVEYERKLLALRGLGTTADSQHCSPSAKRNRLGDQLTIPAGSEVGNSSDVAKKSSSSMLSFFRGATRERSPHRAAPTPTAGASRFDVDSVKYVPRYDRDVSLDDTDFSLFGGSDQDKTQHSKQLQAACHIELQFSDSTANFYCRVYFAEQFQKLRRTIFPAGEDRYIRSLSRCFAWLARGGKSGLTFCKTQDDRFILKQMSRPEVQSFVEFAPQYIRHVTDAYGDKKPTMLAKIVGAYRIGYRNSQTNTALKQDLLVMENLFYGRSITQVFDLKGSVRNRLVDTCGKRVDDLVLLDENLLKASVESPLYVRAHSKAVLTSAIANDTHFLSKNLIMDYSLLLGLDADRNELVVGIIDYIRTFTWDKQLEMVVKSTYSQGKMPTIVSPEVYRNRFLTAMDLYFIMVPDRWTGLETNLD